MSEVRQPKPRLMLRQARPNLPAGNRKRVRKSATLLTAGRVLGAQSGLCETDSPGPEHENWQVIDCFVQPGHGNVDAILELIKSAVALEQHGLHFRRNSLHFFLPGA